MTITQQRPNRQYSTPARRGDPIAEIEQLQDQMGQIISNVLRGPVGAAGSPQPSVWVPPVDIEETDDSYVLDVDLPGAGRDDVNVELRDNEVRITGAIKEQQRSGVLRRQTRRAGQFELVVFLPGDIDPNKVEASLRDGVLTVRVGKSAASQPRQIEVKQS